VGFGSGIYGEKHHKQLLKLAEALPKVKKKKAFLFSTSGVPKIGWSEEKVAKDHKKLREKLESKGYQIIDEFGCMGFNTNSFTKFFGGINKGRPNKEDLENAREFARGLKAE
jgi:flavodoxin